MVKNFFGSDLCPFFWVTFYDSQALPVDEITLACFQPENQMVKCNPRNGKSDSSKLLIPEKDVFLKKNKCPQASTWQSVCSTAEMWYVIRSHLSSSWQICKLLPLKRILHGTFANRYFQDLGMSTQGTQRRERRDHGDQNGAHCGFCQLVPNWIQGWMNGSLDFLFKFCPSLPFVAYCI